MAAITAEHSILRKRRAGASEQTLAGLRGATWRQHEGQIELLLLEEPCTGAVPHPGTLPRFVPVPGDAEPTNLPCWVLLVLGNTRFRGNVGKKKHSGSTLQFAFVLKLTLRMLRRHLSALQQQK